MMDVLPSSPRNEVLCYNVIILSFALMSFSNNFTQAIKVLLLLKKTLYGISQAEIIVFKMCIFSFIFDFSFPTLF